MSKDRQVLSLILGGGRGTRLQEHAAALPKPLVEVGGRPIVWHVVSIYAARGVRRILLLTGFRSALVAEFAAAADWPSTVRKTSLALVWAWASRASAFPTSLSDTSRSSTVVTITIGRITMTTKNQLSRARKLLRNMGRRRRAA